MEIITANAEELLQHTTVIIWRMLNTIGAQDPVWVIIF